MVRKCLSILVLAVMILHCCSRLGAVSYLYKHRYEISYALGLTAERVISVCKGDYFQQAELTLPTSNAKELPADLPQAQDIQWVCPPAELQLEPPFDLTTRVFPGYVQPDYSSLNAAIFHPPLFFS